MVKVEVEAKKADGSSSCTNGLLWLTRAMDFIVELFHNLMEHEDCAMSQVCSEAYTKTLKKYHGCWMRKFGIPAEDQSAASSNVSEASNDGPDWVSEDSGQRISRRERQEKQKTRHHRHRSVENAPNPGSQTKSRSPAWPFPWIMKVVGMGVGLYPGDLEGFAGEKVYRVLAGKGYKVHSVFCFKRGG
nr:glycolipid transfer protein 1 [Tanacetum cinerariifolium]